MSSREFVEWMAYDRLDPLGAVRDDLNFALLSARLLNFFRQVYAPAGTTPPRLSFEELMPKFGPPPKSLTPEELYEKARAAFAIWEAPERKPN